MHFGLRVKIKLTLVRALVLYYCRIKALGIPKRKFLRKQDPK